MSWRDKAASAVEKMGHPGTDKTDKRAFVSNVSADPTPFSPDEANTGRHADKDYWDTSIGYTMQDLQDFDRLLRELAELEDWPEDALRRALADRKRMAPVNVPSALQALRKAHKQALAGWPGKPPTQTKVVLVDMRGLA